MFLDWIFMTTDYEEKKQLFQFSLGLFPCSYNLWAAYSDLSPNDNIYLKATKSVSFDRVYDIWVKYIEWSMKNNKNTFEIFKAALNYTGPNHDQIVIKFINWIFNLNGIEMLRDEINNYSKSHMIPYSCLLRLIELERSLIPANSLRITNLYNQVQTMKPHDKGFREFFNYRIVFGTYFLLV
jgi:hypothetical protein